MHRVRATGTVPDKRRSVWVYRLPADTYTGISRESSRRWNASEHRCPHRRRPHRRGDSRWQGDCHGYPPVGSRRGWRITGLRYTSCGRVRRDRWRRVRGHGHLRARQTRDHPTVWFCRHLRWHRRVDRPVDIRVRGAETGDRTAALLGGHEEPPRRVSYPRWLTHPADRRPWHRKVTATAVRSGDLPAVGVHLGERR